jgi:hypothetical protein
MHSSYQPHCSAYRYLVEVPGRCPRRFALPVYSDLRACRSSSSCQGELLARHTSRRPQAVIRRSVDSTGSPENVADESHNVFRDRMLTRGFSRASSSWAIQLVSQSARRRNRDTDCFEALKCEGALLESELCGQVEYASRVRLTAGHTPILQVATNYVLLRTGAS